MQITKENILWTDGHHAVEEKVGLKNSIQTVTLHTHFHFNNTKKVSKYKQFEVFLSEMTTSLKHLSSLLSSIAMLGFEGNLSCQKTRAYFILPKKKTGNFFYLARKPEAIPHSKTQFQKKKTRKTLKNYIHNSINQHTNSTYAYVKLRSIFPTNLWKTSQQGHLQKDTWSLIS